jgi:ParB/RepB/Spo0J family partition protein
MAKKKKETAESAPVAVIETKPPDPVQNTWEIMLIDTYQIKPSPVNPRNFIENDPTIRELADSIYKTTLLQPITVRPSECMVDGAPYELICGERRWRAFLLIRQEHPEYSRIPAHVMVLPDQEAHELTALENLQREDLSPLEQANGIAVLLDSGRDMIEVADKLGKPVGWVVRRAKLRDLVPEFKKAAADPEHVYARWSVAHLELVARYPDNVQCEIFARYNNSWKWDVSLKNLRSELGRFTMQLKHAPWKPQECSQCKKRSSVQPFLFEEDDQAAKKGDRCLDGECWKRRMIEFLEAKEKGTRLELPNLILMDRADYNHKTLPDDSPLKKHAVKEDYRYEKARKDTEGAFPALIVDGPGAGTVQWYAVKPEYRDRVSAPRLDASGEKMPKTLEERRNALEKRRNVALLKRAEMQLHEEIQSFKHCERLHEAQMLRLAVGFPLELDRCPDPQSKDILAAAASPEEMREHAIHFCRRALITVRKYISQELTWNNGDTCWAIFAYEILGLDPEAAKDEIALEIPEPKSWAGLNEDGTPKKKG